ncbi:MAG: hypothetical protein MJ249_08960 [Kiritimatiellae bacterium]|nr:hypothetical protein [Kiritimatiellia bacterium]
MKNIIMLLGALVAGMAVAHVFDGTTALPYLNGFTRDGNEFVCDNGTAPKPGAGVRWGLTLNQKEPKALVFTAEGKAEDRATGGEFSLYIDLIYTDGTPLWGQSVSFDPDPAAGWQKRTVTVFPARPVRSLTAYLLQRNRTGRVRFRNPTWEERSDLMSFDHVGVTKAKLPTFDRPRFLLRDAAVGSDFLPFTNSLFGVTCAKTERRVGDATLFDVTLTSTDAEDRALSFVYACPIAAGAEWLPNLRTRVPLRGEHSETAYSFCGNGAMSRWPIGAVDQQGRGLALGLDPAAPAVYRIVANEQARCLFIVFDLGFAKEHPTAHIGFCSYPFNGAQGLRGALARYQKLYPEASRVRIAKQGAWMPFHPISKVKGPEDFGFRFKEGIDEIGWDDAHDILSFRYTEPCTWWMHIHGDLAKQTLESATAQARQQAASGNVWAQGFLKSAMRSADGTYVGRFLDTPWCKGIVWSVNSAPGLVDGDWKSKQGDLAQRYAGTFPHGCDGEYVDSAELYVTTPLDFDRTHFEKMKTPLAFTVGTHKVGIFKGLVAYEYVRALAERVWPKGRFMFANSTPHNWCWLAPYVDVLGTETNWNRGSWRPMSDAELLYRRALCGGKPYCFLMNTNFDKFSYACSEKFMRRSLAYGMFPGYFSADASTGHYFSRPDLYERDRPLFKKYMPLCRQVAEAGWQPVNELVTSDAPELVLEQFGTEPGKRFVTVYNLSTQTRRIRLVRHVSGETTRELVENTTWTWTNDACEVDLPGEEVRVLVF